MYRAALLLGLVLITACASKGVTRLDETTPVDLSGLWNDTDTRSVTSEMVRDALARPWLASFQSTNNRRPVLLFDGIENLTAEHIPQETFLNSIQRELLNSGMVGFVADPRERERIRRERADQATHADPSSARAPHKELGADYLLGGSISYIEDASRGKELRVYQVNMTLLSMRDNQITWSGQKIIRKLVERSRVRP